MQSGITPNISVSGVMFTTEKEPELGESIEYVITLQESSEQSIRLRCIGKTVRYNRVSGTSQSAFEIGATIERYEFLRGVPPARKDHA